MYIEKSGCNVSIFYALEQRSARFILAFAGVGACSKWMTTAHAYFKKNEMIDLVSTLGAPSHIKVSGNHAYVVMPANLVYTKKGKLVKETATHPPGAPIKSGSIPETNE